MGKRPEEVLYKRGHAIKKKRISKHIKAYVNKLSIVTY